MKYLFTPLLTGILLCSLLRAQTAYQQTFDLNQDDEFLSCIQTADGGTLTGGYSLGVPFGGIVVKTNFAGTVQWSKTVGGIKITDVVQSSSGMYYAAGENNTSGNINFYLVKLDGNGNVLWARSFGKTAEPDNLYSMALTPDGGVILSGNADSTAGAGFLPVGYIVKVDSSGNHEWSRYMSGGNGEIFYVTKPVSSGGYLSCGYTGSFGSPVGTEAYVVRWDANGIVLWTSVFGHNNRFDRIYDFVEKPNGGFWVTGKGLYTSTNDNLFLASLDNAGQVVWHHNYDMYDDVQRVILLQDGNLAMCGYNIDLNLGIYNQSYLIKTDTAGAVIWGRQYGDGGAIDDKLWDVTQASDGGFILVGSTYGTGIQRTSWVVRTDSAGNSGCRDSALTVTVTNLAIASTSGGTVSPVSFASNIAVGQLNANMSTQYFCGGPNTIPESTLNYVWCYPQPARDQLTVQIDPLVYNAYSIFDPQGKRVRSSVIVNEQTVIDLNGLAAGTYTLLVSGMNAATSTSIIVE